MTAGALFLGKRSGRVRRAISRSLDQWGAAVPSDRNGLGEAGETGGEQEHADCGGYGLFG